MHKVGYPTSTGGRIGGISSDMATKTVLTHDTCRLQKLTGALIYNDAKACFDQIIENMSNMTCMREGLALEISSLYANMLENM
jgi:hypothetical protein